MFLFSFSIAFMLSAHNIYIHVFSIRNEFSRHLVYCAQKDPILYVRTYVCLYLPSKNCIVLNCLLVSIHTHTPTTPALFVISVLNLKQSIRSEVNFICMHFIVVNVQHSIAIILVSLSFYSCLCVMMLLCFFFVVG